jgi:hypothetical protein
MVQEMEVGQDPENRQWIKNRGQANPPHLGTRVVPACYPKLPASEKTRIMHRLWAFDLRSDPLLGGERS